MEIARIISIIEAILFTSDRPVPTQRIAETLENEATVQAIEEAMMILRARCASADCGFELREAQGGYHFCTKVENADWVRKFLQSRPFRLGKSALETLAIIAYRQPITRAEIDSVRGIDSSHLVRTLIERGLVKMAGKAEVPGRPVQYATTAKFLEVVGLKALSDLPPLSELEQLKGSIDDSSDNLDQNLEKFVEEKLTTMEEPEGEYRQGLEKIDEMLSHAMTAPHEVFESEIHSEVARENIGAVESFQVSTKPKRRTIQYSDLVNVASSADSAIETETSTITTETIANA